jgi:peptidoglycan/LPS O-acetylase OafA/YrhL
MYMLLSVLGIIGALRFSIVLVAVAVFGAIGMSGDLIGWFHLLDTDRARFIFMFFCGSSLFLFRERVPMSGMLAAACIAALAAAAVLTENHVLHRLVLAAVMPFLTLWLGFVPGGPIRRFNRLGDYSYGIYILACPVQFYLVDRHGDLSPWGLFALSMMIVLPLAMISWRYLESPMLHMPLPRRWAAVGQEP